MLNEYERDTRIKITIKLDVVKGMGKGNKN
jgi:hypothetical protein